MNGSDEENEIHFREVLFYLLATHQLKDTIPLHEPGQYNYYSYKGSGPLILFLLPITCWKPCSFNNHKEFHNVHLFRLFSKTDGGDRI